MNADDIRRHLIEAVQAIAPEADFARVDAGGSLRGQLDLDSFDFLNLLIDLQARTGVAVAEADYGKVDSLEALVAYVAARAA